MRLRLFFILSLVVLLVCACNPSNQTKEKAASDVGEPVQGDWAVVHFINEPASLNPLTNSTAAGDYAMTGANNSQIYELLLGYNNKDWDLTEPLLAEGLPESSSDHLTFTFKIRDGVKWHDGQPFTADDVLFTFKATACPLTDAGARRSLIPEVADVQVDGRTVRFQMSKANAYSGRNLANSLPIVARHVFDPEGLLDGITYKDIIGPKGKNDAKVKKFAEQFNGHPNNRAPVGTGPYKFEKWDSGRELVLARNENYWGKKSYLDKIVYRFITEYPAALAALKSGDVDFQPRLQAVQYNEQTNGPAFDQQFTKVRYAIPTEYQIFWNNDRPFFKDKRVRQAMTMLVDRQKIIDTIRMGLGKIGVSPFSPQSKDFNPNIKPLPYDPKRAAELLDEAGWKDHDGDGIRDKDGVKFKFEFLMTSTSSIKQLTPILIEEFRKVGIEMSERVVELSLAGDTVKQHRFDASALAVTFDLVSDPYQGYHSNAAAGGFNFENFKNAESDRLLEQARVEFDDQKRKQIYWQWQELIQDEQPVTFLFYQEDPAAISKRFQNVQWIPLRPGYDLTSWWVPKANQKYKGAATR